MAIPSVGTTCTVSKCTSIVDANSVSAAGDIFLTRRWIAALVAGTTTKCLPHYLDTDIPTVYAAYIKGDGHRGNRERG
jgi:hypothetical protein